MVGKQDYQNLVKGILVVTVFFAALFFLISKAVSAIGLENIRSFVASFGPWAPAAYIFLIVFGIVFPIFPGLMYIGAVMFPFFLGVAYTIVGAQLGTVATFLIARRFGRGWVSKLVDKKSMGRVDEVAEKIGVPFLIMARIFPNVTWDFLGYAAGLTRMKFWIFFAINFLGLIPASFYVIFIFNKIFEDPNFVVISGVIGFTYTLGFAIAALYLYKRK